MVESSASHRWYPSDFFTLLRTLFVAQRRLHTSFGIVENPLSFELAPAAVARSSGFHLRDTIARIPGNTTHEPAFTADLTGRKPILNSCRILSSQLANSHEEERTRQKIRKRNMPASCHTDPNRRMV